jgi:glutathione S-transferase
MKLYGTLTSPFVRRVRAVALELGVEVQLVDVSQPHGQELLGAVSPIAKVPVAELDGSLWFDSHAIVTELLAARGHGTLRVPPSLSAAESNFMVAVDGALEPAIRLFYFRRDKVAIDDLPYMVKERERVRAVMTWLEGQVRPPWCTRQDGFGLAELWLITALDWMTYRDAYPVGDHPRLLEVRAAHRERPSLRETLPP